MGTAVSAVPNASTSTASTARPPPAPSQVDRYPRTLPTPTTMITISMTLTQAARNVVTKTEEWLTARSLPRVRSADRGGSAGCSWVDPSALHLLGVGDLRVPRVQREHRLPPPAPGGARRPALVGDPHLPHPVPSDRPMIGYVSILAVQHRAGAAGCLHGQHPSALPAGCHLGMPASGTRSLAPATTTADPVAPKLERVRRHGSRNHQTVRNPADTTESAAAFLPNRRCPPAPSEIYSRPQEVT